MSRHQWVPNDAENKWECDNDCGASIAYGASGPAVRATATAECPMGEFRGACVDCGALPSGKVKVTAYKGGVKFPYGAVEPRAVKRVLLRETTNAEAVAWFDDNIGHYVKRRGDEQPLCGER